MRFTVDLNVCADHGQCVFAAPNFFALDEHGALTLRQGNGATYTSRDIDDAQRAAVEEAADLCPVQAILLDGE